MNRRQFIQLATCAVLRPSLPSSDITTLARTIEGEGIHLLGPYQDAAALWILWTITTRIAHRSFPNSLYEVITAPDGFYGYWTVESPSSWAVELAARCLQRDMNSSGPLWMFSKQDVERLHIELGVGFEYDRWGLYWYWRCPL